MLSTSSRDHCTSICILDIARDVIKALRKEVELNEEKEKMRLSADIETHQLRELYSQTLCDYLVTCAELKNIQADLKQTQEQKLQAIKDLINAKSPKEKTTKEVEIQCDIIVPP